ncbi:hypothetical protein FRB90_004369, partial [Tulasnella sp. 427]
CLQIQIERGDNEEIASTLWSLADVYHGWEKYDEAIEFYSESLQLSREIGSENVTKTLTSLSDVHLQRRQYDKASQYAKEAIEITSNLGDTSTKAIALWTMASVHRDQGQIQDAIPFYMEAVRAYAEIGQLQKGLEMLEEAGFSVTLKALSKARSE